ncbi:hypothetical protein Y032_0949g3178 [Ancylostoma ceylanicum]|uniref:Protein kinase domain-containing protein n=1 Tax=Ancylostoma ceylanicum TaxID=53326 RepID=A0A016W8T0_9BILA|nr:hypothetical protein Y032_0949g3178 [Ancylostoma ceylanicum]
MSPFSESSLQTLKALNYLHNLDPPVIHRDIKAANLLLTISDSIKLANFGLVRDLAVDGFGIAVASDISLDFRGTLLYVAPEVLTSNLGPGNRNAYGKPADVWALGCTLVEMLTKYPPHFEYFGQVEAFQKEILDRASGDKCNWLPYDAEVLVPTCSKSVHKIVNLIFERDPTTRPNTGKLCEFVNNVVQDKRSACPSYEPSISNKASTEMLKGISEDESKPTPNVNSGDAVNPLPTYTPLETLENGAVRRKRRIVRTQRRRGALEKLSLSSLFFLSRILYFAGILGKSVLYVISFLLLGLGTLALFLFISYCIVLFFRYIIKLNCDCDLWQPQYIIISGILLILLFALMFSCCMVALGEYKFRMANKTLSESRFFVRRPQNDLVLCGLTILQARKDLEKEEEEEDMQQISSVTPVVFPSSDNEKFYYN